MTDLSDVDAAVIELVRHEFETMGEFHAEGPNSRVTVDPVDALRSDVDGDHRDSVFYSPVRGEFMDWGFRLICELRNAFPEGADHSVTAFTPYTQQIVTRLLQTWVEVDFTNYSLLDETWISGSIMDAAAAKHARETYANVHGEQPPDSYYGRLVDADEAVMRLAMKTAPGRAFDSADDFRQQCRDGETALFHIDSAGSELTQLY